MVEHAWHAQGCVHKSVHYIVNEDLYLECILLKALKTQQEERNAI